MSAYLIIQIKVNDQERWPAYRAAVGPLAQRFGGRYLVRGVDVQVLEGTHDGRRLVIFEFSSMDSLSRFWNSTEYAELKKLRKSLAELDVWAVSGAAGGQLMSLLDAAYCLDELSVGPPLSGPGLSPEHLPQCVAPPRQT